MDMVIYQARYRKDCKEPGRESLVEYPMMQKKEMTVCRTARILNMGSMYPLLSSRTKRTVTGFRGSPASSITSSLVSMASPPSGSHWTLWSGRVLVYTTSLSSTTDEDVETWQEQCNSCSTEGGASCSFSGS
ncbi:hypothetical protein EYF80_026890 [Liparis tanakae]|uniref:Uncharacterized protein n=1 Tax=Liparis tanakae TaxID=230148 RepID=A0A4Z2HC15_9TELE|nr:hypothetical protein EYF80_026890 [Liparis tanakae]